MDSLSLTDNLKTLNFLTQQEKIFVITSILRWTASQQSFNSGIWYLNIRNFKQHVLPKLFLFIFYAIEWCKIGNAYPISTNE